MGGAVNLGARLESNGRVGKFLVSVDTYEVINDNDHSTTWISQSEGVEIDLAKLSLQEVEELKSLLITIAKNNKESSEN